MNENPSHTFPGRCRVYQTERGYAPETRPVVHNSTKKQHRYQQRNERNAEEPEQTVVETEENAIFLSLIHGGMRTGRVFLKLYAVQHIREKADLIDPAHISLYSVVAHGEYIFVVGNILEIKEKSLGELPFRAVQPEADFHVPAEIMVQFFAESQVIVQYFATGGAARFQVHRRVRAAACKGGLSVEREKTTACAAQLEFAACQNVGHVFAIESGVAFDAVGAFVLRIEQTHRNHTVVTVREEFFSRQFESYVCAGTLIDQRAFIGKNEVRAGV